MSTSSDFLTRAEGMEALDTFHKTRWVWDPEKAARCSAGVACEKLFDDGSGRISFTRSVAGFGGADAIAYGMKMYFGFRDVVTHEAGHLTPLDRAMNNDSASRRIDNKYSVTAEANANVCVDSVRRFYRMDTVVVSPAPRPSMNALILVLALAAGTEVAVGSGQASEPLRPSKHVLVGCRFESNVSRDLVVKVAQSKLLPGLTIASCDPTEPGFELRNHWRFVSSEFDFVESISKRMEFGCWFRESDVYCSDPTIWIVLRGPGWGPIPAPSGTDAGRAQGLVTLLHNLDKDFVVPQCGTKGGSEDGGAARGMERFKADELKNPIAISDTFDMGRRLGVVLGGKRSGFVLEFPDTAVDLAEAGICWFQMVS